MSLINVTVPDIGDFKNIPVIEIHVKPGDMVKADDPLVSLESDKATMEVPAPSAGRVAEILVTLGTKVSMGSAIIKLEGANGAAAPVPAAKAAPAAAATAAAKVAPSSGGSPARAASLDALPAPIDFGGAHASPSVRRLARELDIDLTALKGTGEKGFSGWQHLH